MFRTGYIIFSLVVALSIAVVAWLTQPEHGEPTYYTTSKRCQTCHETQSSGAIYKQWQNSAHAKAFTDLFDAEATNYLKKNQISQEEFLQIAERKKLNIKYLQEKFSINLLNNDSAKLEILNCYKCHSALGYSPKNLLEHNVAKEGVSCETCHGAGSRYSTFNIMQNRNEFIKNGGVVSTLQDCYKCHAKKVEDKNIIEFTQCPLQKTDFNAEDSWVKILHKSTNQRKELVIKSSRDAEIKNINTKNDSRKTKSEKMK